MRVEQLLACASTSQMSAMQGTTRHVAASAAQLAVDLEQAFSARSTSTSRCGPKREDLAAELGADAAAGAGDQDDLACTIAGATASSSS